MFVVVLYQGTDRASTHDVKFDGSRITLTGLRPDPVWRILVRDHSTLTGEVRWMEVDLDEKIENAHKRDEFKITVRECGYTQRSF